MTPHIDKSLNINTQEMESRYQRAEALIQGFTTTSVVQNDAIVPTWFEGDDCCWYERNHKTGKEYRLVSAINATNKIAFDHDEFASALSKASGQQVNAQDLPISHITLTLSPLTVCFTAFDRRWQFDDDSKCCQTLEAAVVKKEEALSPDGKRIAFARDHNLWVRDLANGDEWALTDDGEENYAYAISSTAWSTPQSPNVEAMWSPDSARLLTVRRDKRQVKTLPMVNHVPRDGSIRPQLEKVKVAYPGDKTWRPISCSPLMQKVLKFVRRTTGRCPPATIIITFSVRWHGGLRIVDVYTLSRMSGASRCYA